MNKVAIKWYNMEEFNSKLTMMREAKKAEDAVLKAGGNYLKREIRKEALSTIKNASKQNPDYIDKLIDAVRRTKPYKDEAALSVHIWGTRKTGSGTFRLRFFESSKDRYQTKIDGKPLKKKRKLGNLSKFNGFFEKGFNKANPNIGSVMEEGLRKYIEKNW